MTAAGRLLPGVGLGGVGSGRVHRFGSDVLGVALGCLALSALPSYGAAQASVAESGMGQGQASIGVRSDVTLGIEGARSTPAARLQQIAEAATDQLPAMRRCYRDLTSKHPTASGSVAVRVTLAPGARSATLEVKEQGSIDPGVTRCVTHALEQTSWRKVERPATAILSLEFENSRAKGEQQMAERRQVAERVEVHARAGGGYEANWSTADGNVAFAVSSPVASEGIEMALGKLRDAFAAFADCRRRCEQGGRSPAGSLDVALRLEAGKRGHAEVRSSSVAHPRAVPCVEKAFAGLHFEAATLQQDLQVRVTFGG